jgi:hypothetical protein
MGESHGIRQSIVQNFTGNLLKPSKTVCEGSNFGFLTLKVGVNKLGLDYEVFNNRAARFINFGDFYLPTWLY